jgi:aminoglycoside phosphotransferase (APT) family kinase protein
MTVQPWESDRPLTPEIARGAITASFPTIDTNDLEYLGWGWDFEVYATRDGWAFRFPRRAHCAEVFDWERRVIDLAARALGPKVNAPCIELIGEPGGGFPYRFSAHRLIQGNTAEALTADVMPVFAREIGAALGALHAVSEADARSAGLVAIDLDDIGRTEWIERGLAGAERLLGIDDVVDEAARWAAHVATPIPRFSGPLRFVHQDLGPDHIIVDATTGRIAGIIDWTDAILGDPARDFVFLVAWLGWDFAEEVLHAYPHHVDDGFRERLDSMARLLAVIWLTQAHEQSGNVEKHVRWVHNAFQDRSTAVHSTEDQQSTGGD